LEGGQGEVLSNVPLVDGHLAGALGHVYPCDGVLPATGGVDRLHANQEGMV